MAKENRVLADHKKVGSVLRSPFSEYNLQLGNWLDGPLPELLWVGLMINAYGERDGMERVLRLAEVSANHASRNGRFCFAMTSAYSLIPADCRQTVVDELSRTGEIDGLCAALKPLIYFYPECPLSFLFAKTIINVEEPDEALNTFKAFFASLFDRYARLPVMMKTSVPYVLGVSGRLMFAADIEHTPDLNKLSEYPDTEDSRRVAAMVNSMCGGVFMMASEDVGDAWPRYFWRRGFEIDTCHVEIPQDL